MSGKCTQVLPHTPPDRRKFIHDKVTISSTLRRLFFSQNGDRRTIFGANLTQPETTKSNPTISDKSKSLGLFNFHGERTDFATSLRRT